ncbi:hypothetical protein LCGC14_3114590, partial [marine sediment metagenome]
YHEHWCKLAQFMAGIGLVVRRWEREAEESEWKPIPDTEWKINLETGL